MNTIWIGGFGAGTMNDMPLGVYRKLKENKLIVYTRTTTHPITQELQREGIQLLGLDHFYQQSTSFQETYEAISSFLINEAKSNDILYLLPGHPYVAEETTMLLHKQATKQKINLQYIGGHSFLDSVFASLHIDPIEGFQLIDATNLQRETVQLRQHVLIAQIYDSSIASDVKLSLMEYYPDTYQVALLYHIGLPDEQILWTPLYEIDRISLTSNLGSLYVPPVKQEEILYRTFPYVKNLVEILRGPDGCPWDKEQTHESLIRYILEESYELIEAIHSKNDEEITAELGDLLLQVLLHAQIGKDAGYFQLEDVIGTLSEKLIRRHPHVFGSERFQNSHEVKENWERIKKQERKESNKSTRFMDEINGIEKLPPIQKSYELQKRVAKQGIEEESLESVLSSLVVDLSQLKEVLQDEKRQSRVNNDQLSNIFFLLIHLSRLLNVHPEENLIKANQMYVNRIQLFEEIIQQEKKKLDEIDPRVVRDVWNKTKPAKE